MERRPPAGTAARRAANHVPPLSAIVPQARERRPPVGTARPRRAGDVVPPHPHGARQAGPHREDWPPPLWAVLPVADRHHAGSAKPALMPLPPADGC